MQANLLNKKIIIEKSVPGRSAVGTPENTWVQYVTTWANVYTPTSTVQFNDSEVLVYSTEFSIRYNSTTSQINNKYRIKYNNTYYKIKQITEIGTKEGLKFTTIAFEDE